LHHQTKFGENLLPSDGQKRRLTIYLEFKSVEFWSQDFHYCLSLLQLCKISSKSDYISLKYGDITIFKMAIVSSAVFDFQILKIFKFDRHHSCILYRRAKFNKYRKIRCQVVAENTVFPR